MEYDFVKELEKIKNMKSEENKIVVSNRSEYLKKSLLMIKCLYERLNVKDKALSIAFPECCIIDTDGLDEVVNVLAMSCEFIYGEGASTDINWFCYECECGDEENSIIENGINGKSNLSFNNEEFYIKDIDSFVEYMEKVHKHIDTN